MKLIAAPSIWLAHFTAVYVLLSLACRSGASEAAFGRLGAVQAGVAIATAVALGLLFSIGWRSYWRSRAEPRGTNEWIERVTLLMAGLSALAAVWVAYPAFVLPPCAV